MNIAYGCMFQMTLQPFSQIRIIVVHGGRLRRRRDCHLMAPPCTFMRCFNRDKQGVSTQ